MAAVGKEVLVAVLRKFRFNLLGVCAYVTRESIWAPTPHDDGGRGQVVVHLALNQTFIDSPFHAPTIHLHCCHASPRLHYSA